MIAFLRGTLIEKNPSSVILEVGGVGYEIHISLATYDALPASGSECKILVYEKIAEDAYTLYGFASAKERGIFASLVSVSGVGPKIAIGALSGMTANDLVAAIANADVKRISSLHGIGKKTAERIVVELKDKIRPLEAMTGEGVAPQKSRVVLDTVLALTSLGFSEEEATKMVRRAAEEAPEDASVEDLLRLTLKSR